MRQNKFHTLFLVAFLVASAGPGQIAAQNALRLNVAGNTIYDNNILNYSQYDIQRFRSDTEVHRSVIETYDDLIFQADGEVEYLFRRWRAHPVRLQLRARGYTYLRNPIKNYQLYRFDVRVHTRKRNYFAIGYRLIPEYYLRHYVDRDQEEFVGDDEVYLACKFQLQQVRSRYTHYWNSKLFTALLIEREWLWYNTYFTEYDTESISGGLEVFYFMSPAVKLGVEYMYTNGDNVGQDQDRPSGDSDLSYVQQELTWKLRTDVNNLLGWRDLDVNADFYTRYREYISDAPLAQDVFHSGRTNWRHRFSIAVSLDVIPYLDWTARYSYEDRIVNSDYPLVIQLKEYSTTIISTGLEYAFR